MRAILLALAALGASAPGLDNTTSSLLGHAKRGQWQKAAESARALERQVTQRAPLEVFDMQVLAEPPQGLGIYKTAFGSVVRGEELYLYAQVRNHGLREIHGNHELHLVSDLVVLDEKGEELARDEGFGESRFTARAAHRDTFVTIAVRASGLTSGKYRVRLIIHDRISGKKGQAETGFSIP